MKSDSTQALDYINWDSCFNQFAHIVLYVLYVKCVALVTPAVGMNGNVYT